MKILVVVDMQNDFVTGVLGSKDAQDIVPRVLDKISNWDGFVIFTRDTHFKEGYSKSIEGQNIPIHCIYNTDGWQIVPPLSDYIYNNWKDGKLCIDNKYSFGSYNIVETINRVIESSVDDIEYIEFVGLCTNMCVISNVMIVQSEYINIPIIVDALCCAGSTPEKHEAALDVMESCLIKIVNRQ